MTGRSRTNCRLGQTHLRFVSSTGGQLAGTQRSPRPWPITSRTLPIPRKLFSPPTRSCPTSSTLPTNPNGTFFLMRPYRLSAISSTGFPKPITSSPIIWTWPRRTRSTGGSLCAVLNCMKSRRTRTRMKSLKPLPDTSRILANRYWGTFVNLEQYERLRRSQGKVWHFTPC